MSLFLGIDTSNYTSSAAIFDTSDESVISERLMLPVKDGAQGLRQSDAVFHHTVNMPKVIESLSHKAYLSQINAVGVSCRPRNIEGSYMPCFLCGEGLAQNISNILNVPMYRTSHQVGHILSALYSAGKLNEFTGKKFIAFHVSGGTTDCLLCDWNQKELTVSEISTSLDLKAGQLIDRTGVMMGLKFPCGKELEKLALESAADIRIKPIIKNGNISLSGFENKFRKAYDEKIPECDIALSCITAIGESIISMTKYARQSIGDYPVIYAGGVMSDKIIKNKIENNFDDVYFALPEFSCDNGAGAAIYAKMKSE